MKTKFYLLTTFVFLSMAVSAQKYNVMLIAGWINNSWADTLRTTNTYDLNGNLIKLTSEVWNAETSGWDNAINISHTLNSDATIKESLTQFWENNAWVDALKSIYTYSASKKILTQTSQMGFEGSWMDLSMSTYTYDENDRPISMVTQVFNINSNQITYTYNSDGTENQQVTQNWSGGQWVNSQRTTHTYNASKLVTSSLGEKWESEAWVNDTRSTITYNAAGSITESMEETWMVNAWANTSKEMYTYTTNGELQQLISQLWNPTLSVWENNIRATYNYNSTGINPVEVAAIVSVFPNPFEDQIIIESNSLNEHSIQVFTSAGQMVNSFKTNASVTNLNLGALKQGVYFMKVKSLQNEQTIKLLKAR